MVGVSWSEGGLQRQVTLGCSFGRNGLPRAGSPLNLSMAVAWKGSLRGTSTRTYSVPMDGLQLHHPVLRSEVSATIFPGH